MAEQFDALALLRADPLTIKSLFCQSRNTNLDLAALGRRLAARRLERLALDSLPMSEPRSLASDLGDRVDSFVQSPPADAACARPLDGGETRMSV